MEPVFKPKLTVSFAVDLDLEYDTFNGKTIEQIAESLQDELHELSWETSPCVVGVASSITAIEPHD